MKQQVLFGTIRLLLAFTALFAIFVSHDFQAAWLVIAGFMLSFIPQLIQRTFDLNLPWVYELVIVGFIVASLVLGEFFDAYQTFWWWDKVLHLSSGIVVGYVGFMVLYVLKMGKKFMAGPMVAAFFTFMVVMASASLWEIVEFTVDKLGYGPMQHGLDDSMWDMILAAAGGVVASAAAYWQFHSPSTSPLGGHLRGFRRQNKHKVSKKS